MLKKAVLFIVIFLFLLCAVASLAGYLLTTSGGAERILRTALDVYVGKGAYSWKGIEGSVWRGITIRDLELKGIRQLPEAGVIRVQEIQAQIHTLGLSVVEVKFVNARLLLSKDDPIVAEGRFQNGRLEVNIYTRTFNLRRIKDLLPGFKYSSFVNGDVKGIDLVFSGDLKDFHVQGQATVGHWYYGSYALQDCPVNGDLHFIRGTSRWLVYGKLVLSAGDFLTPYVKTSILPSHFHFDGEMARPSFHIKGQARVKRVKIDIDLQGTRERPVLSLSSDPTYPREQLLLMLTTGKRWESLAGAGSDAQVPALAGRHAGPTSATPEVASDFVDYFFFGGSGKRVAEYFGLSDISIKLDNTTRGLELNKDVSDRLGIGYGIEALEPDGQLQRERRYRQMVEGAYDLNENITIDLERELVATYDPSDPSSSERLRPEDKVYLKYRTKF